MAEDTDSSDDNIPLGIVRGIQRKNERLAQAINSGGDISQLFSDDSESEIEFDSDVSDVYVPHSFGDNGDVNTSRPRPRSTTSNGNVADGSDNDSDTDIGDVDLHDNSVRVRSLGIPVQPIN